MRFRGVVALHGKTATGIEVPAEVVDGLGGGRRPKVRATINGYAYRSSVAPMGGAFLLPVSAEVRAAAGISAGDAVEVGLEIDTEPRTVTVPDDLAAALDADPAARQAFDALSYSQQQRHVLAIEGARTPETRRRRLEKVLGELRAGTRD
ncbi:MAG TPA: YdeI/OmpD-associated family protein [Thermomicrobiaceae bacterium]|nr:YdeI/OmpD-associated family protein [Thermomicrobiaceae bacterium]